MRNVVRQLALIVAILSAASCSWFGDQEKELEPKELVKIENKLKVKRLWSTKIGDESEFLHVALRPVGDGNRIYAASRDGNVVALNPESGKQAWKTKLDMEISAGPGVGEGLVAVLSGDGELIVLEARDGTERWRTGIDGESLAAPVISGDLVMVQTIDNRLRAVSSLDGSVRWTVHQATPALTLRGSATPVVVGARVIAGFDNGRLVAVDIASGDVVWESLLAPPSGRSDLDRLSDVDGLISVVGQDIYAAGYQGRLAAVAAESGQLLWSREISTYVGIAADWTSLYTTNQDGEVIAMSRQSGNEIWRDDSLLRRYPTLPVPFHTTVAVGDLEGYIHFFSTIDGEPVARLRQGGKAITSDPLVIANRMYVQSDSGSVAAYTVEIPKRPDRAPDIAEDETPAEEGA